MSDTNPSLTWHVVTPGQKLRDSLVIEFPLKGADNVADSLLFLQEDYNVGQTQ